MRTNEEQQLQSLLIDKEEELNALRTSTRHLLAQVEEMKRLFDHLDGEHREALVQQEQKLAAEFEARGNDLELDYSRRLTEKCDRMAERHQRELNEMLTNEHSLTEQIQRLSSVIQNQERLLSNDGSQQTQRRQEEVSSSTITRLQIEKDNVEAELRAMKADCLRLQKKVQFLEEEANRQNPTVCDECAALRREIANLNRFIGQLDNAQAESVEARRCADEKVGELRHELSVERKRCAIDSRTTTPSKQPFLVHEASHHNNHFLYLGLNVGLMPTQSKIDENETQPAASHHLCVLDAIEPASSEALVHIGDRLVCATVRKTYVFDEDVFSSWKRIQREKRTCYTTAPSKEEESEGYPRGIGMSEEPNHIDSKEIARSPSAGRSLRIPLSNTSSVQVPTPNVPTKPKHNNPLTTYQQLVNELALHSTVELTVARQNAPTSHQIERERHDSFLTVKTLPAFSPFVSSFFKPQLAQ